MFFSKSGKALIWSLADVYFFRELEKDWKLNEFFFRYKIETEELKNSKLKLLKKYFGLQILLRN